MLRLRLSNWRGHRRPDVWFRYVGAVGLGAAIAGISRVWLPSDLSASIGVATTLTFGRLADLYFPEISKASAIHASRRDHLGCLDRNGRLTPVGRLSSPMVLGVHPVGGHADDKPPIYIERDIDHSLRQALNSGRFVLIIGESAAGKTRTAYEAMRTCFPLHFFIQPISRGSINTALQVALEYLPNVVWLDDLENYLGPDALGPSVVNRLIEEPQTVIIATMRTEEHRRYNMQERSVLTGADRDSWRLERSVVHMAASLRLERLWSPDECDRARECATDARIANALKSPEYGVAEVLAAGPALAERWLDAWTRGTNPRGAAIVAAVVDCRRLGLRRPVPESWLGDLHELYLDAKGGAGLQPESYEKAMEWARRPVHGTGSLLRGNATDGYAAFDYLLDIPRGDAFPEHLWFAVLPQLWNTLLPQVTPAEAYLMGLTAQRELRFPHAEEALHLAAAGSVPGADFSLAVALGDTGRHHEAIQRLEGMLHARSTPGETATAEQLTLRHQIAYFRGEQGERIEAARLFAELVLDASTVLGTDHIDTLAARHQRAHFTGEAGDCNAALCFLRPLLEDRLRVLGPDHPHTIATRRSIAWFTGLNGDLPEAIEQLSNLLEIACRALGPDDPHVFAIRGALANFTGRAGNPEESIRLLSSLWHDRAHVLGRMHPHVLVTRQQLALFAAQAGHRDMAIEQLDAVIEDMRRVLDASHTHLRARASAKSRHVRFVMPGAPVVRSASSSHAMPGAQRVR